VTGAPIDVAAILPILLRRKRVLALSGLAVACLAFSISRILPLKYTSEGNLIVENHASASPDDTANPTVINGVLTQVDVLQSKGLIRSSVRGLNTVGLVPTLRLPAPMADYLTTFQNVLVRLWRSIDDGPRKDDATDNIITYIQKHLRVEAKDNSSVISVRFEAGAPDTSSAVVNAIMATYISTVGSARDLEIAGTDQWIDRQTASSRQEVMAAEHRVTQFLQNNHNLSEVQGSLTAAIKLSKDQARLTLAQEDLAKQQAGLDTISHSGGAGAEETLTSRSIQNLKELEAKTIEESNALASQDPRRASLQSRINGLRAQINNENKLVVDSISRNVQIARAHVQALQTAVQKESEIAEDSTVAGATLKQLTGDLDAKRQLNIAFLTRATQVRLAALQAPSARILFQGVSPQRPVHSFGELSLLFGFLGGILLSSGIIIMRSALSLKINSTSEMATVTGLPVLGSLPEFKGNMLEAPMGPLVTETFRGMWVAMRSPQSEGKVILVTSSEISEGKTTVATALARRYAHDGFRVLLIDADLRRPQLAKTLNLRPANHLESVLSGAVTLEDALVYDPKSRLNCLLTNGSLENPVKALSSDGFKQLLTAVRRVYDFVILDSPPALHVADPIVIAGLCQHIIFIVQADRVPGELVSEAIRRFAEQDRIKMSTLLTRIRPDFMDRSDYYSGYRIEGVAR
jgi:succinoglycan biosynthesis transport protein ExoP